LTTGGPPAWGFGKVLTTGLVTKRIHEPRLRISRDGWRALLNEVMNFGFHTTLGIGVV